MAEVIGRKFVENGQQRILQRIFDGVNSDFVLDTSDFKESDQHKLLHLVWRKFPRNKCPTEGLKTTISDSTQTAVELRHKISENFIIPVNSKKSPPSDTDWVKTRDMRGPLGANDFKTPEKRQSSKPKTLETTKYQIGTSNRFAMLKNDIPVHKDILVESGQLSPPPSPRIFSGKKLQSPQAHKSKPKKKPQIARCSLDQTNLAPGPSLRKSLELPVELPSPLAPVGIGLGL